MRAERLGREKEPLHPLLISAQAVRVGAIRVAAEGLGWRRLLPIAKDDPRRRLGPADRLSEVVEVESPRHKHALDRGESGQLLAVEGRGKARDQQRQFGSDRGESAGHRRPRTV